MAVLDTVGRLFGRLSIWLNFVTGLPDVVGGARAMFSVLLVLLSEVVRLFILKAAAHKRHPQALARPVPDARRKRVLEALFASARQALASRVLIGKCKRSRHEY